MLMTLRRHGVRLVRGAAAVLLALSAAPLPAATRDTHTLQLGNDVFIAGETVRFAGEAGDDALLAGGEVSFGGAAGGDAAIAGGEVSVAGRIGEDLYAAGGEVRVSGDIGGSVRIAGGEIDITERARIADGASIAGGQIDFGGHAGSYLQLNGGRLSIDGRVEGDVIAAGGTLRIGPEAVIGGRLVWRGREAPDVAAGAQVRGGVQHIAQERPRKPWALIGAIGIGWFIGWLLAGTLLLALLPRATRAVSEAARARPLAAALAGFLLLIGLPFVIVLCAVTLVGIPLAALLLLAWLLLLPLGYLLSVTALADMALGRRRAATALPSKALRIGAFAVALLIAFIVSAVPLLGTLVTLALLLLGAGGILLALRATWSPRREA